MEDFVYDHVQCRYSYRVDTSCCCRFSRQILLRVMKTSERSEYNHSTVLIGFKSLIGSNSTNESLEYNINLLDGWYQLSTHLVLEEYSTAGIQCPY